MYTIKLKREDRTISVKHVTRNVTLKHVGRQGPRGPSGRVESIVAGTNITVDNTDPANPIVHSTAEGLEFEYTNATPMPETLGGLVAGTTFSAETIGDIFDALFYPYQTPAFSSFNISGQATTVEVGTTISGSKTFTWATTNGSNVEDDSVSIAQGVDTLATGLANDGTESVTITSVQKTVPGSETWTITADDTNNDPFDRDFTVNWLWRIYSGTSTNATLTEAQIEALAGSQLASSGLRTYSLAAGGYKYIAYPESLPAATAFTDTSTQLNVSMTEVTDNAAYSNVANGFYYALVSVTNAQGVTTNYRVYRSQFQLTSALTVRVD